MVKYTGMFLLSLLAGFFVLFATFPKFLFIDKILIKNGVFLLADSVKESLFDINLKNTKVYSQNKVVLKDSNLLLKLSPSGIRAIINCEGKTSEIIISLSKDIQANLSNLTCLTVASEIDGKVHTKDGVYGKLLLKDIKAHGKNISSLELDFKGKTFFFKANIDGINIDGSGNLDYDKNNPANTKINAVVSSVGFNVTISGSLLNPQINLR